MVKILLSLQENLLFGGSSQDSRHHEKPYIPIAIIEGDMGPEECQRERRERFGQILPRVFSPYWGVRGTQGDATLEELDLNPDSDNYGETIKDPVLLTTDELDFHNDWRDDFPFKRREPVVRLEKENEK